MEQNTTRKAKIALIGVGNEFRQDDGIGAFIVRALREQKLSDVALYEHRGEGVDLLGLWEDFNTAILFDAVKSGSPPGTIHRFEFPEQDIPKSVFCCSTHVFSVADVIHLGKTLDQLPPRLIIYGVEGKYFDNGIGLSQEAKEAAEKVVEQVTEEVLLILGLNSENL